MFGRTTVENLQETNPLQVLISGLHFPKQLLACQNEEIYTTPCVKMRIR